MKFSCEQCGMKYSLDDARVAGRVLKIRCKSCQGLITVQDPALSARPFAESTPPVAPDADHTVVSMGPSHGTSAAAQMARGMVPPAQVEWFVSFDGAQEGPLPLPRVHERIRQELPLGKEIYCWREGYSDWLPAQKVSDMLPALRPPRSTTSVSAVARAQAAPSRAPAAPQSPMVQKAASAAFSSRQPSTVEALGPEKRSATGAIGITGARPSESGAAGSSEGAPRPSLSATRATAVPLDAKRPPLGSAVPGRMTQSAIPAIPIGARAPGRLTQSSVPAARIATQAPAPATPLASVSASAARETAQPAIAVPKPPIQMPVGHAVRAPLPIPLAKKAASAAPAANGEPAPFATSEPHVEPTVAASSVEPAIAPAPSATDEAWAAVAKELVAPPATAPIAPVDQAARENDSGASTGASAARAASDSAPAATASVAASVGGEGAAESTPTPTPARERSAKKRKTTGSARAGAARASRREGVSGSDERAPAVSGDAFGARVGEGANVNSAAMAVVAETQRGSSPGWLRVWGGAAAALIVFLVGTIAWMVAHRPPAESEARAASPAVAITSAAPAAAVPVIDDRPVGIAEQKAAPTAPAEAAPAPVMKPTAQRTAARNAAPKRVTQPTGAAALSSEQKELMNIYGGEQERADVNAIPSHVAAEAHHEQVSDAAIAAAITRNKKSVQVCYERVLKHDESLRNLRVDVDVKVGVSGNVSHVAFSDRSLSGNELGECLAQSIRRWHFPSQDSEYQTSFPLLLQAQ